MKHKIFVLVIFLLSLCLPNLMFSKQSVAISTFDTLGLEKKYGISAADNILQYFIKSNKYNIVERSALEHALKEAKLSTSDLFDKSKTGKLLSLTAARFIVIGKMIKSKYDIEIMARVIYIRRAVVARQTTVTIAKPSQLQDAYKVIAYELMNDKSSVMKLRKELEEEAKEAREEKIEIDSRDPEEDNILPENDFLGVNLFTSTVNFSKNETKAEENAGELGVGLQYMKLIRTKWIFLNAGFTLNLNFGVIEHENLSVKYYQFMINPGAFVQFYGFVFLLELGIGFTLMDDMKNYIKKTYGQAASDAIDSESEELMLSDKHLLMELSLSIGYILDLGDIQFGLLGKLTLPFKDSAKYIYDNTDLGIYDENKYRAVKLSLVLLILVRI